MICIDYLCTIPNGDTIIFHDNYVAVKYQQETKNLAEKMAADVFGECKVLYTVDNTSVLPDEFDNTTTFEEFTSEGASQIAVYVMIPPEHSAQEKEKELKQLEQIWIENRFVGFCSLYYFSDAEAYQSINPVWRL